MHDPDVVVADIPAPWPHRYLRHDIGRGGWPRWGAVRERRTNPEHLGQPTYPWWRPKGYRFFAAGWQWKADTLLTVWHHEPGGADSGTVCAYRDHWRHPQHWHLTCPAGRAIRRRLLTRCAWCHGKHRRANPVNCSGSWDRDDGPWWRGERSLYHSTCLAADRAWRSCICTQPMLDSGDHGRCYHCGGFREWGRTTGGTAALRVWRTIGRHTQPPQRIVDLVVATRAGVEASHG